MNIAYMRVSTTKQNNDSQKLDIDKYCKRNDIVVNDYVEVIISSRKTNKQREIDATLDKLNKNDILVVNSLDRLGRSVIEVMQIIKEVQDKEIELHLIRENIIIEKDSNAITKMLLTMLAGMAEMERNLISERTKSSLNSLKNKGVKLGRNYSKAPATSKYDKVKDKIIYHLNNGLSITKLSKVLGFGTKQSLANYINKHNLR